MKQNHPLESILVIVGGLLVFYLIYKIAILLIIALALICLSLLIKPFLVFIDRIWMTIAKILGYINSKILLGQVFYLFLTPLALLRKMFSKNENLKNNSSNFYSREHIYHKTDFDKPF